MEKRASLTTLISALVRAYHYETAENPVFSDTAAKRLFGASEYERLKKYIIARSSFFMPNSDLSGIEPDKLLDYIVDTQLAPNPIARAKYCEERLKSAILSGTSQYVIIGAGYDTFAWREPEIMKRLSVFETDHPLTQTYKQDKIARADLITPPTLHFVPVDFSKGTLKEQLIAHGLDIKSKIFFSWLGASYYMSEKEIRDTFSEIAEFAAEGSTIVFDYADENFLKSDVERVKNMISTAEAEGESVKFCTTARNLAKMLEEYRFFVYEELSPEDIDYQILGNSGIKAFEHINYVTATVKNEGKLNTKERIFRTALRMFSKRGYDAVSVRDISAELGITQAALYKHYKNKQDIFDSIIRRMDENNSALTIDLSLTIGEEGFGDISADILKQYVLSQFTYWTQDGFASLFRKMLTVEQYKSAEMARLYRRYISEGPLKYVEELLRATVTEKPEEKAVELYAPVFMMMNMYDSESDKSGVYKKLVKYTESFKL